MEEHIHTDYEPQTYAWQNQKHLKIYLLFSVTKLDPTLCDFQRVLISSDNFPSDCESLLYYIGVKIFPILNEDDKNKIQ